MSLHPTEFGAVETLETGTGPELVVLLHAAASGAGALAALAGRLARPGRRVVVPALAGYGATRVAGRDPVAAHVAVARWALDHAPAARRVLFGHSMGGLAATLAAAGRADLDALVLYEPIVMSALNPADPEDRALAAADARLIDGMRASSSAGDPESAVAAFVEAWNEVRWTALPDRLRARLVADADRLADEAAAVSRVAVPPAAWPSIGAPTIILHGQRSPPLATRLSQRLAARLPRARVRPLAGLGHMGPALDAGRVAAAFEAALAAR